MTELSYGPFISRKQAIEQGLKHFYTGKPCVNGHRSVRHVTGWNCMQCLLVRARQNRREQPEREKEYKRRQNGGKNRERYLTRIRKNYKTRNQLSKQEAKAMREYHREYMQERRSDPKHRIEDTIRSRILGALKRAQSGKTVKTEQLLGCTLAHARAHLEAQFLPGMSWDNHGEWHIDHIRPCASFDLTDPEQQKQCFHYTNLQPLWAVDNLEKGDQWNPEAA